MILKSNLLLYSFLLLSIKSNCQKIQVGGEETNRKLKWSDFSGQVDTQSPFDAKTNTHTSLKMGKVEIKGDSILIQSLELTVEFSATSWAKANKQSDVLLKHEQAHFDLDILCAKEILSKLNGVTLPKASYNSIIQKIVGEITKKYSDLQSQYDTETKHAKDREQQLIWENFIAKEFEKYQ